MTAEDLMQLRQSLASPRFEQSELHRIEGLGEPAFTGLRALLEAGGLSDREKVNGLKAMGFLGRHVCRRRLGEVVDLAIRSMADDSRPVRSSSAEAAIWSFMMLEQTSPGPRPDLLAQLGRALLTAIAGGVTAESQSFITRFLSERGLAPSPLP